MAAEEHDPAAIAGQQDIEGQEVTPPLAAVPDPDEQPLLEELRVDGTAQLSAFDLGGKRASSSSLRLSGGKILLVDGQAFRKGDVIHFEGTAVVRELGQRDKPDPKTGIVVAAEQKHVAQITDLVVRGG